MTGQPPDRPVVPEIDVRSAWERVEQGEATIVDVRENEELAEIAVPGALHVPLGRLRERLGSLPAERDLYILCRSGNRSGFATEFLQHQGFNRAANISGGIIEWAGAGLPVKTADDRE